MTAVLDHTLDEGVETVPISLAANATDLITKFRYCSKNIPGPGIDIGLFLEQHIGCICDICEPETCPCIQQFGQSYRDHKLIKDIDFTSRPILECSQECKCSVSCCNRLVQHRVQWKLKAFKTEHKGFAVLTEENIPKNSFVCEYAGEILNETEARHRWKLQTPSDSNYIFVLKEHTASSSSVIYTFIDPQYIGNIGRLLNHSCDPNLFMLPVRIDNSIPHLALFAKRDIKIGEELCYDYSGCGVTANQVEDISELKTRKLCFCKAVNCSGYIPYDSGLN